jgi:RES domain-containing protein
MTRLPAALGGSDELVFWRLDRETRKAAWDSGEGAFLCGGRWNNKGVRAVYCSLEPATAILELAVHKGFNALDTVPHVMTAATNPDIAAVHIVKPDAVPNPNWLRPGIPSAGQMAFGDDLLSRHRFVAIPSVVYGECWNLIFDPNRAKGLYAVNSQERFALDTRLTLLTAPRSGSD